MVTRRGCQFIRSRRRFGEVRREHDSFEEHVRLIELGFTVFTSEGERLYVGRRGVVSGHVGEGEERVERFERLRFDRSGKSTVKRTHFPNPRFQRTNERV